MKTEVLLESAYIELDPMLDGFAGVLVELIRQGEEYLLSETAVGTGNRIFCFSSTNSALAYKLFRQQLRYPGYSPLL